MNSTPARSHPAHLSSDRPARFGAAQTRTATMLLALFIAPLVGCGNMSLLITPVPTRQALEEHVLRRESAFASDRIAILDVDGLLSNARERPMIGPAGDNPVAVFKEKLDRAAADSRVKAVVVRINSPGGTVTASDLMFHELRAFKARTGKPVVAAMLDVAASGGYYIACAADEIVAHPTTVTGSIGVIMVLPEMSGLMGKIGVRTNVFKSGEMKDAGSPFREMGDAERAILQGLIDDMYERFVKVVRSGRPSIAEDRVRSIADGRIYTATQALEHRLIDRIGTLEDAISAARMRAGLVDRRVVIVQYARPLAYRANVYAAAPDGPAQVNYVNVDVGELLTPTAPQFMYLWAPGW